MQKTQHRKLSKSQREQRRRNMESGACFVSQKVGCRPYKCRPHTSSVHIEEDVASADELFNSGDSGQE